MSSLVSFLDTLLTSVLVLGFGIALVWVVTGMCRKLTRKDRNKKDRNRIDSSQVALLDSVVRV